MSDKLTVADCDNLIELAQCKKQELLNKQKEEPEKRERLECWATVYGNKIGNYNYKSEVDAKKCATTDLIRTVRLVEPPTRKEWEKAFQPCGWISGDVELSIKAIASMGCVTEEASDD